MQCCRYADLEIVLEGEEKERVSLLLDLLTPVAKSYPSETGIFSTSLAIQCLGGYGYCEDFSGGTVFLNIPFLLLNRSELKRTSSLSRFPDFLHDVKKTDKIPCESGSDIFHSEI